MSTNNSHMKMQLLATVLLVSSCFLVGCDNSVNGITGGSEIPKRDFKPEVLSQGKAVFSKHCAGCHGKDAEGDPLWRKPNSEGKYPPPPLNGSGHAWHHSREILTNVIKNGSLDKMGDMPAMGKVISDKEIQSVVTWIQSLWSEQAYKAWYTMQQQNK